jgi:hypothetical protein
MSPENVTLAMYRVGSMKRRDELPSRLGKRAEVHGSMPPHIALHLGRQLSTRSVRRIHLMDYKDFAIETTCQYSYELGSNKKM